MVCISICPKLSSILFPYKPCPHEADLVPVGLVEEGSGEDDDVEEDAETVVDGEGGDEPQEEGLEVERGRGDHSEGHQVACQ